MNFDWFQHDADLAEKYQLAICELENGEVIGAIAKPSADKPWVSTAPYEIHFSKEDAVKKLEDKAKYRIDFLER